MNEIEAPMYHVWASNLGHNRIISGLAPSDPSSDVAEWRRVFSGTLDMCRIYQQGFEKGYSLKEEGA